MSFYNVSETADNNSTIGGIASVGSASAGVVDNLIRQLAAQDKQFLLDLGGANTVGGTANAITITPASGAITAAFDGLPIVFKASATNTSETVTAAVGGLNPEPVKKTVFGAESSIDVADIRAGSLYMLRWRSDWDDAGGAWELVQLSAGTGLYTATSAATSGTEVSFTSIPPGVEEITLILDELSLNGDGGGFRVQIGDSGGFETTGYVGGHTQHYEEVSIYTDVTDGAGMYPNFGARTTSGVIRITKLTSAKWKIHGVVHITDPSNPIINTIFSSKTLTGTLDRVRVVPTGALNFDGSGSIKIIY